MLFLVIIRWHWVISIFINDNFFSQKRTPLTEKLLLTTGFKISEQQSVWIIRTCYLKIYCNTTQKCITINEYANYQSATFMILRKCLFLNQKLEDRFNVGLFIACAACYLKQLLVLGIGRDTNIDYQCTQYLLIIDNIRGSD